VILRFGPRIRTTKGSKSRLEMTHGHVSTSQTLDYPLLPPSSQNIVVFQKQHKKIEKEPWVGTTAKLAGRAMQITHAWSWATMKRKERKKNPPKASEEKKERQRSPNFTRKARKCKERLVYKTKGVKPNPRVERNKSMSNTLKVLTQYNPQTLFEPLESFFS